MKWLVWILLMAIGLTVLCAADFTLGKFFHRKNKVRTGYPVRKGEIRLITRGAELFSSYFDDLYKATSSIHILFYIVKGDSFSRLFFEILMEQARKGVRVRLLLDWFGSRLVPASLLEKARSAGVEIVYCHRPRLPFLFFSLQQRNHRKVTIIDGKVGYVGGFNVGREYIDLDPVLSPWRDYHLRIEGEGIADLQTEFLLDWEQACGVNLLPDSSLFPALPGGPMAYRFFPTTGVDAVDEIRMLLERASSRIIIGTPYFIPPETIMEALKKAIQRGVQVTVLVPNQSDHPIVKEASLRFLQRILEWGGTVYQYKSGFFHAKAVLIDDDICDIGTANFDCRSFLLNYEMNCFIYDRTFIKVAEDAIRTDIGRSTRLMLKDLKNPPVSFRMKELAGMALKRFL